MTQKTKAHFSFPPSRNRHLALGSLNAPALRPLHTVSSLFFSFKAPIDFEIKLAVPPPMNLKLASPFPCSPPFKLSHLLRFLLFLIHLL